MNSSAPRPLPPMTKLLLEIGPLVLFFLTNAYAERFGVTGDNRIFVATGLFILATLIALAVHYSLTRHIPLMPLISGVVVVIFGGLTLALQDEMFIKIKPTLVNSLFGAILLIGLCFKKSLLSYVLDSVFSLTEEGWRILTLRWGLFFFFLALVNEIVWRTQSTDFWVSFKVFGIMPMTMIFAIAQLGIMRRYEQKLPSEGQG
jgi:intracellular septation protein